MSRILSHHAILRGAMVMVSNTCSLTGAPTLPLRGTPRKPLLVSFIGAPGAAKTTVASLLFSSLKQSGVECDLTMEVARRYIAHQRYEHGAVELFDDDQWAIMSQQKTEEDVFLYSTPLVISDSSIMNTLLYMTPKARAWPFVRQLVAESTRRNVLYFHVLGSTSDVNDDQNRLHDAAGSEAIARMIPNMVQEVSTYSQGFYLHVLSPGPSPEVAKAARSVLDGLC